MAQIFVDAGFLIALSDPEREEDRHQDAAEWVEILEGEPDEFLTTEFCLVELVDHHSDVGQRELGRNLVDDIRHHSGFEVVPVRSSLIRRGMELHSERDDKSWSLTDCISLIVMRDRNVHRVLAFDRDFEQAGMRVLNLV